MYKASHERYNSEYKIDNSYSLTFQRKQFVLDFTHMLIIAVDKSVVPDPPNGGPRSRSRALEFLGDILASQTSASVIHTVDSQEPTGLCLTKVSSSNVIQGQAHYNPTISGMHFSDEGYFQENRYKDKWSQAFPVGHFIRCWWMGKISSFRSKAANRYLIGWCLGALLKSHTFSKDWMLRPTFQLHLKGGEASCYSCRAIYCGRYTPM